MNEPAAPAEKAAKDKGSHAIHAEPTKNFFVTMITRDISLADCIFDLLDNSIDGAHRQQQLTKAPNLNGYWAKIEFSRNGFAITDNCGGISLSDAINYAFHFGRKPDAPHDVTQGIGLYGIGMKRAIFKMGRLADVESETKADSFKVGVNVDIWEKAEEWDFQYEDKARSGNPGAAIRVTNLYRQVADTFEDKVFATELIKSLARDYAFFLANGFKISVGPTQVPTYRYDVKASADLVPASLQYVDENVSVRIVAGLLDELPDEVPDELKPEVVARYGWFVLCNDRVVLAGDKTDRTVWGNDGFATWHPQYNGFGGFVFFSADDPKKLPWTTTKREIDTADPLYRRAVSRMKEITKDFISYTGRRKVDLEQAKQSEQKAAAVSIATLPAAPTMSFPKVGGDGKVRTAVVTISYQKPKREVDEVRQELGNPAMSARDVGKVTFEYFRKKELGK